MFFFVHLFLNEALPMLDPVAPTIDNGYPVHFIICVFRSYFNKKNLLIYRTNFCIIVISLTSLVLRIHEPEIVDPPLGPVLSRLVSFNDYSILLHVIGRERTCHCSHRIQNHHRI